MRTAAVVLAAGGGRRYGMPKALVEYEGSLLVERAVATAGAVCDPVLVVLGARAVDVWRSARLANAVVLANKDWESGMASSLRTGLDGLRGFPGRVDAALVTLVDMPGMTPEALRAVAAHAAPDALATATYDGVRGHPVLIGRDHWAGVAETATGDEGARRYLAAHDVVEVDCTGLADPVDLDVPPPGVASAP
ncbi:nucleotidyltransferase family protein [Blastococcus sp. MG754426]|uniref:nucleotidyltransferase family protein n=1 Tax=unclassified Blastococcus TaxID=2619396 RepID=UPI001EF027E2|nr:MULTISPECIES: nucleotidyltransferase family protein [unclassified Blastococcus]MCF6506770.1 nucleotidyltransferase family protein [Blastococcus sp. MG754426]MCF6511341.1 nucleotidyltransferase family protein [Blastococcus sp. MG754427]MCF6734796.1 nucleotidyltransferase family protein [Blastococcus sp. KM273129]